MIANPAIVALFAECRADLDRLARHLPHAPSVDCHVRGCHDTPYLQVWHSARGRRVLTCRAHDPGRFGDGKSLFGLPFDQTPLAAPRPSTGPAPTAAVPRVPVPPTLGPAPALARPVPDARRAILDNAF